MLCTEREVDASVTVQGKKAELMAMYQEWPFFQSTMDLVEMILAKADMRISAMYDDVLVSSAEERQLGQLLRDKFVSTVDAVLEVRSKGLCSLFVDTSAASFADTDAHLN